METKIQARKKARDRAAIFCPSPQPEPVWPEIRARSGQNDVLDGRAGPGWAFDMVIEVTTIFFFLGCAPTEEDLP